MRIFIDLIHPANIHYFKNFIFEEKAKGNTITISARKKDVLQNLLREYNLDFIDLGKGSIGKGAMGKALYLMKTTIVTFFLLLRYRPNIVLSFGSTPCAIASFLLRIPHISFEDTEHAKLNRKLYAPITPMVFTPSCFYEDIGENHYRFNSYMEMFYLHPKRFIPNKDILNQLGLQHGEEYIFMRFVSWGAFHDIGQNGVSLDDKIKIVLALKDKYKIFISSEGDLPAELAEFKIKLNPSQVHDVLSFSKLYIGEGGTMASEACMLGIPSIYINSLPLMGYLKDCQKNGLLFHLSDTATIIKQALEICNMENYREHFNFAHDQLIKGKIDPTAMLIWLVDNYPASKKEIENNKSILEKF